jgi:hypothetical protein
MLLLLLACRMSADPVVSSSRPCGDISCADGAVCVEERYEPPCSDLTDTGAACPDGTSRTFCGGAGMPCCCGEAPAPTYACAPCDGASGCDCVTCADGKWCSASAVSGVVCEAPAVP